MQKVPAWSATDGRVFTDRTVCKAHDAYLALVALLEPVDGGGPVDIARLLTEKRDDAVRLLRAAQEAPPP